VTAAAGDPRWAFDPFDAAQTQTMWERWAEMRREAPITRPRPGFVFVARHADVKTVFRDNVTYSAREGFRAPGVVVPEEESFLGEIDPPAHMRLRMLMMQAFRPGLEKRAEPFTRAYAAAKLEALAEAGGGDLVSQLGIHLPPAVTAHVLGISTDEIERVGHWGFELLHSTWPATNRTERGEGLGGAFPELAGFLDEQIDWRRSHANPPDDLITRMIHATDSMGRPLSSLQIRTLCANCLLASQSTANLIGNLMHRFVSEPALERKLRAERKWIPAAVEESLRFDAPVLFLFRTAKVDTELAGEKILAGERIVMGIASGNRDERVYDRAGEFVPERWPGAAEHLTFGPGPHLCLGNQLARMEARVVVEEVIARFREGGLRFAPGYARTNVPMFLEWGPERLDVAVETPRSRA
jgi:cytochrome P450